MSETQEREAVVNEALSWKGTKYHHMGRVKGAGADCGMFILETFERTRLLPHIDIQYYPPDIACHSNRDDYMQQIKKYSKKVDRPVKPGDIIMYKFPDAKVPHHAAIVIDDEFIIHSYSRQGVIISNRRGYQRFEVGIFSFWG